jgi:O-antigen/teichoic acid export membrane protein
MPVMKAVLHSGLFRASTLAALIRLLGLALILALQVLLARLIDDPEQFGVYAWGQNLFFILAGVYAFGIPVSSSRLVAVHARRGDWSQVRDIRRAAARYLLVACSLGALLMGVALALSPAAWFSELPRNAALLAALAAPLGTFMVLLQSESRARSALVAAFLPPQVLRPLFTAILALLLWWWGSRLTPMQALFALCGSVALVLVVQRVWQWRHDQRHTTLPAPHTGELSQEYGSGALLTAALPNYASRLCELMMERGGLLLLGVMAGPEAAGFFFVAERLAQLALMPRSVVAGVVQPWFASAHAEGDRAALQRLLTQSSHLSLWPTLLAVLFLGGLSPLLLNLFGEGYRDAGLALAILLIARLAGVVMGPAQQVLIMAGAQTPVMRVLLAAALLHLLCLFLAIPLLGTTGAALASLASTVFASVLLYRLVRRRLDLYPSVWSGQRTGWRE